MTEQQSTKASLYRKIAAVAGAIGSVEKDGWNPQLKYKYATPATVMEAVKPLLAQHQLAIVPMINQVIKEPTGSKTQGGAEKVITRVEMTYMLLDGETGESLACQWAGEGEDWSDKGIAKAQTIAMRTFLLNLFQIPSEDSDPDAGQKAPQQPQRSGASYDRPQAPIAPQKPAQQAAAPANDATPKSRADWASALKAMWGEIAALGGIVPADQLAIDLDDPDEATIEKIKELGKKAKPILVKLRAAEKAAADLL